MKLFRCWYLTHKIGWLCFEKAFKNQKEATEYCETKTDFKGSAIVEQIEEYTD